MRFITRVQTYAYDSRRLFSRTLSEPHEISQLRGSRILFVFYLILLRSLRAAFAAFCCTLERDGNDSLVALELVLAQPAISSQLIDNLNASIHLRALLTDLFLFSEILRTRVKVTVAVERQ